jgi:hypothetical protein
MPGYGQQQPGYGQQQPGYGQQTPPDYSQQPPPYQPPVYNQTPPANPQYPQQVPPPYPQPQPKKSNRGLIVGCSIAAVLLILVCGGVGVAVFIGAQRAKDAVQSGASAVAASAKVAEFCLDYQSRDYGSAYQLLSSAAQGRTSQTQFASHQAALDASAGDVVTCAVDTDHPLPSVSGDGKTATARLQVARGENANLTTGTITLVFENDAWKIDSADSSLKLL